MASKRELPQREPRPEKIEQIDEMLKKLSESGGAIFADYRGLTVKTFEQLRVSLRGQGGSCQVVKNTLMLRAANELGYSELDDLLQGPTAAIFLGKDIVPPTKALVDFLKGNANKPAIKGGYVEGRKIDAARVRAIADLPSREILLAMLVGTMQSPMSELLSTLQASMGELAATLQSLSDQKAATA